MARFDMRRMMTALVLSISILCGPAAPLPPCTTGQPLPAIATDARQKVVREYLWANSRFPQMNAVIRLRMLHAYLSLEVPAAEFLKVPSPEEVAQVGLGMNGMHKRHGVAYRTEGSPDAQKDHEVKLERIKGLVQALIGDAIRRGRDLFDVSVKLRLKQDGHVPWMRALYAKTPGTLAREDRNAAILDAVFAQKDLPAIESDLRKIGRVLTAFFENPKMIERSRVYLEFLKANLTKEKARVRWDESKKVSEQCRQLIRELLAAEFSDLSPEDFEELMETLYPAYET